MRPNTQNLAADPPEGRYGFKSERWKAAIRDHSWEADLERLLEAKQELVRLKEENRALLDRLDDLEAEIAEYAPRLLAEADAGLTVREVQVLRLLADGQGNDTIGRKLFISPETVRTHVRKAMIRLNAANRTEAVATAIRRGYIQ